MAIARWLETDSNSNKDISSAAEIGAYTADADRLIVCDVSLDQVAGNGDYVIYVTRQINGAGSAYVLLPKTTCAAASGETAIAMQSGMISVRSGDVLKVYLDGLAGDTTTPDTTVRWFEMAALQPTDAGRTLDVSATGEASANVTYWAGNPVTSDQQLVLDYLFDMIDGVFGNRYFNVIALQNMRTVLGLASGNLDAQLAAVAKTGADGDTLKTLSDQIDAIDGSYAGSGTGYYTDTIDDGTNPLDGVRVQLYTAPNRVGPAYEAYTNALGVFEMWPDPGVYYRWLDLAGFSFPQDVAVTVTEP